MSTDSTTGAHKARSAKPLYGDTEPVKCTATNLLSLLVLVGSIVQRFCDVAMQDAGIAVQVRYGSRDLEDAMVAARRELQLAGRRREEFARVDIDAPVGIEPAAVHVVKYNYALHRSLRSHFLSSWVNGGLIVDDGTYEAAWYPKKNGLGMLCIRVDKQIGFTRSADVIEDYSKFLNLLAPALASMLVEELVYYSVLNFLGHGAGQDDSRGTEPPLSMTNRKGLSPNVNAG